MERIRPEGTFDLILVCAGSGQPEKFDQVLSQEFVPLNLSNGQFPIFRFRHQWLRDWGRCLVCWQKLPKFAACQTTEPLTRLLVLLEVPVPVNFAKVVTPGIMYLVVNQGYLCIHEYICR